MTESCFSTRRDPRFDLRPGAGFVELGVGQPGGELQRAPLRALSICGVAFEAESERSGPTKEAVFFGRIAVGACRVSGEIVVRSYHPIAGGRTEVGALFRPSTQDDELLLAGLVAGLEAAAGLPERS